MADVKRNLALKIAKLLDMFPAVCILGVRQAGKTSLAKQLCPTWKYVDLEKQSDYERITADPEYFFQEYSKNLIIDEAQIYPEIFNILRGGIDEQRHLKGRFILTGSSSMELLKGISESLAGRIAIVNLGTLKANELYNIPLSKLYSVFTEKNINKNNFPISGEPPLSNKQMQHCWLFGGYPEPVMHSNDPLFYQQWMENYFNTYINRDIARLFPRLNRGNYQRFIKMLGRLTGTILNQNDLARALEVSAPTVKEYLDIVAGTYVWRSLPSYETNVTKSTIKMPKVHITDTGLLHYFLGIQDFDGLFFDPLSGRSFEAFVIEEIIKGLDATFLTDKHQYYYRTKSNVEVDLILESPNGLVPIEIKQGKTINRADLKHLKSFMLDQNLSLGIVVNQSNEVAWLTNEIVQVPLGFL